MPLRCRSHQRRRLRDVTRLDLRTCIEQERHHLTASGSRGAEQWRLLVRVADVDVRATRQKTLHSLDSVVL